MKHALKGIVAAFAMAASATVAADNYPSQTIKIVAPFGPGGVADVLARLVGDKMSKSMGVPVIVENRPGAGGNIGADFVAKAEPNGYTLLMSSAGILTINGSLYPKLSFDPAKSFAPITLVADMPSVVVINGDVPGKSLQEFVGYARKNEGKIFFSSPGNGTTPHLGAELFQRTANVKVTHVPYKGGAQSIGAVVSGEVTGAIETAASAIPAAKNGKVRILAVAGPNRLPQLPEVPTTREAGLADAEVISWFGLVAPAGTPPAVVDRLHAEVAKALKDPDVEQKLSNLGMRGAGTKPAEFVTFINAERTKWDRVVKEANIRLQ